MTSVTITGFIVVNKKTGKACMWDDLHNNSIAVSIKSRKESLTAVRSKERSGAIEVPCTITFEKPKD